MKKERLQLFRNFVKTCGENFSDSDLEGFFNQYDFSEEEQEEIFDMVYTNEKVADTQTDQDTHL